MYSTVKFLSSLLLICCVLSAKSQTSNSPKPYSNYRIHNGLIYISGQIALSGETGKLINSSFDSEANQVIQNIKTILKQSGSDLSSIINVVVYIKDISQYAAFNKLYMKYFKRPFPARSCVVVKDLAAGANIEIAAIAASK